MQPLPPLNGFLLVNKPAGPSSAGVSNHLKWMLKQAGYPKTIKIGHGGTLDPLADGLLPIGIGRATKQLQQLLDGPKTYTFTLRFGTQTTTDDTAGEVTATSSVLPTNQQILTALQRFTGAIQQTPSAFSALKINGRRAYQLARNGETPQMPTREITIYNISLDGFDGADATFTASVSKGTYIRTLGRDLAVALGSVGHITRLSRIAHGPFTLENAQSPETLDNAIVSGQITTYLLPPLAVPPAE
jgi:tRNA pseudouridine55 synthase